MADPVSRRNAAMPLARLSTRTDVPTGPQVSPSPPPPLLWPGEMQTTTAEDPRSGSARPMDPEIAAALKLVRVDGLRLGQLPEQQRRNPHVVEEAVRQNGLALQWAGPWTDDPRVVTAAVQQDGTALQFASARLQLDPKVVGSAVTENGSALRWAGPELRQDPRLALLACRNSDAALDVLPPELWRNKAFCKELVTTCAPALARTAFADDKEVAGCAIRASGRALKYAGPTVQDDAELVHEATWRNGWPLEFASARLRDNKDVVLAAVNRDGQALRFASARMQADPEIAEAALASGRSSMAFVSPALKSNPDFLLRCAQKDPLLLDKLSPPMRSAVCAQDRTLERQCQDLRQQLEALHIQNPDRFDLPTLRHLIRNRQADDPADKRPVALFIYPQADWNGAFEFNSVRDLSSSHRVMYYEVGSDDDMIAAWKQGTAARKASLVEIGGHGERQLTAFGAEDPARSERENEGSYLDLSDGDQLRNANLSAGLLPGAHVVVGSCSTGSGRDDAPNVANLLATYLPRAYVHAPVIPTNHRSQLDAQGRFLSPGFLEGSTYEYVVQPR